MRIYQTSDADIIARLNQSIQNVHATLYPMYFKSYEYQEVHTFFQEVMSNKNFVFLVIANDSGELVGYAWLERKNYIENAFRYPYQSMFVHHLSIEERHRQCGYGSALMDYIYEFGRRECYAFVELDYWLYNQSSAHFYEKQGFVPYRNSLRKPL